MNRKSGLPSRLTPRRLVVLCLVAGTLAWGALGALTRGGIPGAGRRRRELAAGRYAPALGRLERLAARPWPGAPRSSIRSACEAGVGHIDLALNAWARVPRFAVRHACRARARRVALDHGRLAIAEASVTPLLHAQRGRWAGWPSGRSG